MPNPKDRPNDGDVVVAHVGQEPVKLLQRVVEIGNEEEAHRIRGKG